MTHEMPLSIRSIPKNEVVELDVRPLLRSGGEPFQEIMQSTARVGPSGALRLLVTFEPFPLYHVLGNQGFSHWVESGNVDDWVIWFYREEESPCAKRSAAEATALLREFPELKARLDFDAKRWTLDVRQLPPPEPMEMTLSVLEKLPAGTSLLQINERLPQFLFPLLEQKGFRHSIVQQGAEVRILIEKDA